MTTPEYKAGQSTVYESILTLLALPDNAERNEIP